MDGGVEEEKKHTHIHSNSRFRKSRMSRSKYIVVYIQTYISRLYTLTIIIVIISVIIRVFTGLDLIAFRRQMIDLNAHNLSSPCAIQRIYKC